MMTLTEGALRAVQHLFEADADLTRVSVQKGADQLVVERAGALMGAGPLPEAMAEVCAEVADLAAIYVCPVFEFLSSDWIEVTGNAEDQVEAKDLIDTCERWLEGQGHRGWGRRTIMLRLIRHCDREIGVTSGRNDFGLSFYAGLRLRPAAEG